MENLVVDGTIVLRVVLGNGMEGLGLLYFGPG